MRDLLLLTGAAGMLGRDLVPFLYEHTDADLVLLLHRQGTRTDAAGFLERHYGLPHTHRIRILQGDVTKPDLGLDPDVRRTLQGSVTHILHAAASTRFDLPLEQVRRINLGGTMHLAALAEACPRLRQFGHVSTAYVCGRRTGLIHEHELAHEAGFVNTYEQAKYEAERFLQPVAERLPLAVYRLSTVFGDSRTGAVHHMIAPHHALKILYSGLGAMLPGLPDYRVDLIPGDFAAAALGRLFLHHFQPGETYHLTATPEKSYALEELVDAVFEAFGTLDPEWGHRRYPRPVFASSDAFRLFLDTAHEAGHALLSRVLETVQHFADQLTFPKTFDRRNVLAALPDYDETLPDIRQYCAKVVAYCLKTQWGRYAA